MPPGPRRQKKKGGQKAPDQNNATYLTTLPNAHIFFLVQLSTLRITKICLNRLNIGWNWLYCFDIVLIDSNYFILRWLCMNQFEWVWIGRDYLELLIRFLTGLNQFQSVRMRLCISFEFDRISFELVRTCSNEFGFDVVLVSICLD